MKIILIKLIVLVFLICSCSELNNPLDNVSNDLTIKLNSFLKDSTTKSDSILADGISLLLIKATLGDRLLPSQQIVFNTSHGLLTILGQSPEQGQKTITVKAGHKEAIVVLYSEKNSIDNVLVSASIGNYSNAINIKFNKAYPEILNIHPNLSSANTVDTITVNVEALRSNGYVSEGIHYSINNLSEDSIQVNHPLHGVLINQKGYFKITNPLNITGTCKFEVSVNNSSTDLISQTFDIKFN